MVEVAGSLGDRRKGRCRPLFIVVHVEVLRTAVAPGIVAIGVVEVGRVATPDEGMLVRIRITEGSPRKELAEDA